MIWTPYISPVIKQTQNPFAKTQVPSAQILHYALIHLHRNGCTQRIVKKMNGAYHNDRDLMYDPHDKVSE